MTSDPAFCPDPPPPSSDFHWVAGELSQVQLSVENLLPADLRVSSVSLLTDGSAMDVFPSQLTLAARSGQHVVNLVGAPQQPGRVVITGESDSRPGDVTGHPWGVGI